MAWRNGDARKFQEVFIMYNEPDFKWPRERERERKGQGLLTELLLGETAW